MGNCPPFKNMIGHTESSKFCQCRDCCDKRIAEICASGKAPGIRTSDTRNAMYSKKPWELPAGSIHHPSFAKAMAADMEQRGVFKRRPELAKKMAYEVNKYKGREESQPFINAGKDGVMLEGKR